jgi:hypothetical protein
MAKAPLRTTLDLSTLTRWLARPQARGGKTLRSLAGVHALDPRPPAKDAPGRRQTLVAWQDQVLVVVDEFHGGRVGSYSLTLRHDRRLSGGPHVYRTRDAAGPLAVHVLGDYRTEAAAGAVTWRQELAHGRFLVVVTRDPAASARVAHGWAVEVRTAGRVLQLLHSNRGGKVRRLGPIQTDALFGVTEQPASPGPEVAPPTAWTLLETADVRDWMGGAMTLAARVGVSWQAATTSG